METPEETLEKCLSWWSTLADTDPNEATRALAEKKVVEIKDKLKAAKKRKKWKERIEAATLRFD